MEKIKKSSIGDFLSTSYVSKENRKKQEVEEQQKKLTKDEIELNALYEKIYEELEEELIQMNKMEILSHV